MEERRNGVDMVLSALKGKGISPFAVMRKGFDASSGKSPAASTKRAAVKAEAPKQKKSKVSPLNRVLRASVHKLAKETGKNIKTAGDK